jgi:hypothetical protein
MFIINIFVMKLKEICNHGYTDKDESIFNKNSFGWKKCHITDWVKILVMAMISACF